jgi:hypothetical protein
LTKIFEKEAVWAIISTMLDDVGPTMLDPFKQGLKFMKIMHTPYVYMDYAWCMV